MRAVVYGAGTVGKATGLLLERAGLTPQYWDIALERCTCAWGDVLAAEVIFLCLSRMNSVDDDSALLSYEVQNLDNLGYPGAYVQRTTCVPGTADLLCRTYGLVRKYVVWPEFLREAHWKEDTLKPDRMVIGVPKQAVDAPPTLPPSPVVQFLRDLAVKALPPDTLVISVTARQAELAKLVANAALAARISFWNEIAEKFHDDIDDRLVEAVVSDSRLKSFDVFFGRSYGGKCLVKDVPALAGLIPGGVIAGTDAVNKRLQVQEDLEVNPGGVVKHG